MKITRTFSLTPILRDGVWYVEWAGVTCQLPGTEDAEVRNAWTRFRLKKSAGKDAFGHYYDSKKDATDVIRDFKKWWQERHARPRKK
jgi:hypothetical protein